MRGLAFRRHHKQRMEKRAEHVIRCVWGDPWRPAYKYADNLRKCSCEFCQPGLASRQTKIGEAIERDQLEEAGIR